MQVRNPQIKYENLPVHYFGGRPVATHLCNGLSFLFPAGEHYFIRAIKRYESEITDPELKRRIALFTGQEKMHAHEHERMFDVLREQGFKFETYMKLYEFTAYGVIEKLEPRAVSLAVTAALEHFTAIMAEAALGSDLLEDVHPATRRLFLWHCAEELEHKSVAFDVYQTVNGSYFLRVFGLFSASLKLLVYWSTGTFWLLAQDRGITFKNFFGGFARVQSRFPILRTVFLRGIREYLKPGFHPDKNDNYHLAKAYLGEVGKA
ncbi:MAG: metal-dependent hydrolase [Bdellovibrionia bacterium]